MSSISVFSLSKCYQLRFVQKFFEKSDLFQLKEYLKKSEYLKDLGTIIT